jgi:hypothetical protein
MSRGFNSRTLAPRRIDPGFAAGLVNVNLSVSAILANTANGNGTIRITDSNGDFLQANVGGRFIRNGSAVFFNGTLSGACVHLGER